MNWDYARHALPVLLLATILGLLLWSVGFGIYLNRIHSHGWASTRRLLRTLPAAAVVAMVLCGSFWEDKLVPQWALAHAGQSSAQIAMAGRYVLGDHFLAKNPAKARSWITRAARGGSAEAQLVLAGMDLEGRGLDKPDLASALSWGRLAGGKGLDDGNLFTGAILLNHPELAQPGEKAQAYFDAVIPSLLTQARSGSAQAMFSLGMLKVRGQGLPLDPEGGYTLLLEAQAKGITPPQALLFTMLKSTVPPEVIQRVESARRQGPASGR